MPDSFDYPITNSENARLLQALIDDAPEYTQETNSRNAEILKSIINNTEYTDAPQSEIEELLLRLKVKIGGEIEVDELTVTENGTYDAGVNKAYNPVTVELPLDSKTITENGTYTASDDNLEGFDEVTVAVEGYAKKSIPNTPTAIATFNASAMPMPSLTVGIEATQDLHGYDHPWPAGGGKNKLNSTVRAETTVNGIKSEVKADNTIVASGESTQNGDINVSVTPFTLNAGTYTISINGTDTRTKAIYFWLYAGGYKGPFTIEATNHSTTFTTPEDYDVTSVMFRTGAGGEVDINARIQLESGSTATSYAPYENECPITGYSAVNVYVSPTTVIADGTTYTTTLKDGNEQPLTCYGGELSNENGVQSLTVNRYYCKGGWTKYASSNGYFAYRQTIPSAIASSVDTSKPMCNMISEYGSFSSSSMNKNIIQLPIGGGFAYMALQEDVSADDVELSYIKATPTTIPQDSLAIATNNGVNNLWADTGDIQSGEYMEAL